MAVREYGGPEVLHWVELPEPHAGPGEVRVQVRAAGLNPVDSMLRTGLLTSRYEGLEPPFVAGMEVAGVVDEIGPDVDPALALELGQDVVGFVDFTGSHGGHSEAVVLPAASVTRSPANASTAEAASFLNNALTARNALDVLALPAGATVLVTGAAGAVGGYATQLAAAQGLQVVAVASAADEDAVREFGASWFLPRGEALAERVRAVVADGVDAVVDAAVLRRDVLGAVRDGGQVGSLRGWADPAPDRGLIVRQLDVRQRATDAEAIRSVRDLAEAGGLAYRVSDVVPADQVAAAHRTMDAGGVRGRIVLEFAR